MKEILVVTEEFTFPTEMHLRLLATILSESKHSMGVKISDLRDRFNFQEVGKALDQLEFLKLVSSRPLKVDTGGGIERFYSMIGGVLLKVFREEK